jgi:CubicO group peptidase (beta-lactamase class C family)
VTGVSRWDGLRQTLEQAVAEQVFPGAALLIGRGGTPLAELYVGNLESGGTTVSDLTVYDLSSLTKPLATLSVLLVLAARGDLSLDDRFASIYPEFVDKGPPGERGQRESITLLDLLAHRAGLQAVASLWRRLQDECPDQVGTTMAAATMAGYAAELPLEYPPRAHAVYSDLGFIMLGVALERHAGLALEELVNAEVMVPLGAEVGYRSISTPRAVSADSLVAPCGSCSWREGVVRGVVQDENAWAMGGVAGHAGLFGNLRGVQVLVAEYVAASQGHGRLLDRDCVLRCWQPEHDRGGTSRNSGASTWVYGWDTPTPGGSSAGRFVSPDSVGHLGFTGTSVWIDRARGVHVILLTNRLHPDRENVAIRAWRPRIHDAAFSAIDAELTNTTVST